MMKLSSLSAHPTNPWRFGLARSAVLAALLGCLQASAADTDWPQFRGHGAMGLGLGKRVPTGWSISKGKNVAWRTAIPGLAHSSPIVWNDKVFVTTAERPGQAELKVGLYGDIGSANDQAPHQWRLLALDKATGSIVFNSLGYEGVPKVKRHPKATHCNSTPATDGKHVVALFGSEGLFCFDMSGKLLWRKDLGPLDSGYYMVKSAQWGFASSPVIYENRVLVLCDVQTNSFLAAFQIEDGKELWRTARTDVPTWGSPTVAVTPNGPQILVNGWHQTGAYDFGTGKEIWTLDGGGDIPVPTPIFADGLAYFTSAHGRFRPMIAVRWDAHGNITPKSVGTTNDYIVWAHPRQGNYMQTPIKVGEHLYACTDNGIVTCFSARTGAIVFSERIGDGAQGFTASPVSDGTTVYFMSEEGWIFPLPANGTFTLTAPIPMDESTMATPAISNGALFVRTRGHLVSIAETQAK